MFGTKRREPTITEDFRDRLYEYIGGITRNEKATLVAIGGVSDHVHLLVLLPPTVCIADFARVVKANSSKWVRETAKPNHGFAWQKGYSAFSVSHSNIDAVQRYIRNQQAHHRRRSFREEYLELLERHGIQYQEEYVFEDES